MSQFISVSSSKRITLSPQTQRRNRIGEPFGDQVEGAIGAMASADRGEAPVAPADGRSEHGIDPPLELRRPPADRLGGRLEAGLEIEGGVEGGVRAGAEPRLADKQGPRPQLLRGEAREDVDQALVSQLGPVRVRPRLGGGIGGRRRLLGGVHWRSGNDGGVRRKENG